MINQRDKTVSKYWFAISSTYSVGDFYFYVPRPDSWFPHPCVQTLCSRLFTQMQTTVHNLLQHRFSPSVAFTELSMTWWDVTLLDVFSAPLILVCLHSHVLTAEVIFSTQKKAACWAPLAFYSALWTPSTFAIFTLVVSLSLKWQLYSFGEMSASTEYHLPCVHESKFGQGFTLPTSTNSPFAKHFHISFF